MARESEITAAAERACERLGLTFRGRQREVVVRFVRGRDVFVSLPTGSGKSLCYECLPWTFDQLRGAREQGRSIVVVVTPLISLMKDQVGAAVRKGVNAVYVSGSENGMEEKVVEEIQEGLYQLLFFNPESLLTVECWREMMLSEVY